MSKALQNHNVFLIDMTLKVMAEMSAGRDQSLLAHGMKPPEIKKLYKSLEARRSKSLARFSAPYVDWYLDQVRAGKIEPLAFPPEGPRRKEEP